MAAIAATTEVLFGKGLWSGDGLDGCVMSVMRVMRVRVRLCVEMQGSCPNQHYQKECF